MSTVVETGVIFSLKESLAYTKDKVANKQIVKGKIGNITLFAFDEGQELREHTAPCDAVVQALEGSAELSIAGEPHTIQAGEMMIFPANIPHAVKAITPFKMLLTLIRE